MKKPIKYLGKYATLFVVGGVVYLLIELIVRGHTHWTMGILGGICFLLIGGLNNWFPWRMPLALQGVIGGAIVTALELYAGLILNVQLGLNIWDYSRMPLNLWGQICLPFSIAWVGLSIVAVILDDWLRYWLFHEPKPQYTLFRWGKQTGNSGCWCTTKEDVYSTMDYTGKDYTLNTDCIGDDGSEHCVFCGRSVPGGTQVCPSCELKLSGR